MAASQRGHKYGISIFERVRGLLRSGAWSTDAKPIWYEVYRRFPPPKAETRSVKKILYAEDLIRKKYLHVYGNSEPVDFFDCFNEKGKSEMQRFVDEYFRLQKEGVPVKELFERTGRNLQLTPLAEKQSPQSIDDILPRGRESHRSAFSPLMGFNRRNMPMHRSDEEPRRDRDSVTEQVNRSFAEVFGERTEKKSDILLSDQRETTEVIKQAVQSSDIFKQEVPSSELFQPEVPSNEVFQPEVPSIEVIKQQEPSSDVITQEAKSSDIIEKVDEKSEIFAPDISEDLGTSSSKDNLKDDSERKNPEN